MSLVLGTNCGFVTTRPTSDPVGSSNSTISTRSLGVKDTSPTGAAKITEIGWWQDTSSSTESNFEVGIYDHNSTDDEPENLLDGVSRTNAKGTNAGWKIASGLNISISEETVYWITVQLDGTVPTTQTDWSNTGGNRRAYLTSQTTLPDPWGTSNDLDDNNIYAIYAIWETDSVSETVEPSAQTLTLSQQTVTIVSSTTFEPPAQTLTLTQQTPTTTISSKTTPNALELTLAQQEPDTISSVTISPNALSLNLSQKTPTIFYNYTAEISAQSLSLALQAPTIVSGTIVTPSALTLTSALNAPTTVFSSSVSPTTLELTLTQQTPNFLIGPVITPSTFSLTATLNDSTEAFDNNFDVSSQSIAATLNSPDLTYDYSFEVDSQSLTASQPASTIALDLTQSVSAQSLTATLKNPTTAYDLTTSPSTVELTSSLLTPTISVPGGGTTVYPDLIELNLSLHSPVSGETGGYQPLHMPWGYKDGRASGKPDSLSLFWKGRIVDEKHYEPRLSEYSGISQNLAELAERVIPTHGQTGLNVNAPLNPLMPHIKRNKDNHLEMFLEGKTAKNKTLFRRIGRAGAKFGEGAESDTGLLKKWAESNKTKN